MILIGEAVDTFSFNIMCVMCVLHFIFDIYFLYTHTHTQNFVKLLIPIIKIFNV